MKKRMEGNEEQRRAKAREAREQGGSASEAGATVGSSKQRDHETDPSHAHQKDDALVGR